jgi:hypothetical protein
LRPPLDAVARAAALGDAAIHRAARVASRPALSFVDVVLESRFAEELVKRVVGSALAERALRQALAGALVDVAGQDIARHAVIERVAAPLVASGELDRIVEGALSSPSVARLADQVIDSPAAERMVARLIESPLMDEAVARLLESEDLWLLIDEIARSPAVTDAIGRQSVGFADQVAGAVRARSRNADERLEMAIRRLIGRRRAGSPPDIESDGEK